VVMRPVEESECSIGTLLMARTYRDTSCRRHALVRSSRATARS